MVDRGGWVIGEVGDSKVGDRGGWEMEGSV